MAMRLYCSSESSATAVAQPLGVGVHVWRPSVCCWMLPNERVCLRTVIARMYFALISAGAFEIWYAKADDGTVAHTSYVVGSCLKFRFMRRGDFEIGPCWTNPSFRGRGIYPYVLQQIVSRVGHRCWMIVDEKNNSSIRGIEKAGFQRIGNVSRLRWLKIYRKADDDSNY